MVVLAKCPPPPPPTPKMDENRSIRMQAMMAAAVAIRSNDVIVDIRSRLSVW